MSRMMLIVFLLPLVDSGPLLAKGAAHRSHGETTENLDNSAGHYEDTIYTNDSARDGGSRTTSLSPPETSLTTTSHSSQDLDQLLLAATTFCAVMVSVLIILAVIVAFKCWSDGDKEFDSEKQEDLMSEERPLESVSLKLEISAENSTKDVTVQKSVPMVDILKH